MPVFKNLEGTTNPNFQLGRPSASGDRYLYFAKGTNWAGFRYNSLTSRCEYSDDGLIWQAFASGSFGNLDGGVPSSVYGGTSPVDGGVP